MLRRLFMAAAGLLAAALCALPSRAAAPVVVIFPFAVNGSAPEDLGVRLANQLAAEMTALGGLQVVRGAATTKPADYRTVARAAGADVYLSGSIATVFGASYSAIEQVVSTHSGTVMWSLTTHFRELSDVSGEGGHLRDELLRGQPSPPPGIAASGASLVTPGPVTSDQATPGTTSGFAVLRLSGSASDDDRALAETAIVDDLQQRGFSAVTVTSSTVLDSEVDYPVACTKTGVRTLVAGSLDTTRVAAGDATPQTTAHVALHTYDCRTHVFDSAGTVVNHIAPATADAIRGAVQDAVSAFPAPS